MNHHLVISHTRYIARIEKGKKRAECRLSIRRIPPFGHVRTGDVLWFKTVGGPVTAFARARKVIYWDRLTAAEVDRIRKMYEDLIAAGHPFYKTHRTARYATVVQFGRVTRIDPFWIAKKDRRGWVVLSDPPPPWTAKVPPT